MKTKSQRKRAHRPLLIAALGVATVSYVGTQSGCAPDGDASEDELGTSSAPYDDDEKSELGSSQQALSISASAVQASNVATLQPVKVVPVPVGNLMAPPVGNLMAPPPVGNLMPPPVLEPVEVVPVPTPVGNLMAPPPIETKR